MPLLIVFAQLYYFQSVVDIHRQELVDYNNVKALIELQEELDREHWKLTGPHKGPGE